MPLNLLSFFKGLLGQNPQKSGPEVTVLKTSLRAPSDGAAELEADGPRPTQVLAFPMQPGHSLITLSRKIRSLHSGSDLEHSAKRRWETQREGPDLQMRNPAEWLDTSSSPPHHLCAAPHMHPCLLSGRRSVGVGGQVMLRWQSPTTPAPEVELLASGPRSWTRRGLGLLALPRSRQQDQPRKKEASLLTI
ncbi:hypothetical protein P7K49_000061 [Saguinus oedipus]|uniref:Uncharacterized protein n=1 Tax=Saguinus oedipus TaxID=9490 RepID=A0ABQ9WB15_SAGOE|nr:hypothetical protein P7K49_000061 [Saguinus oedipus]